MTAVLKSSGVLVFQITLSLTEWIEMNSDFPGKINLEQFYHFIQI